MSDPEVAQVQEAAVQYVVGESGQTYETVRVEDEALGVRDQLITSADAGNIFVHGE